MSPHHKSARWRGAGVHTPHELARKARHLDRRNINTKQVLDELRRGAFLQLSYGPRPIWRLSSGSFIRDEVARAVIGMPCVTGCGDTLLAGEPCQTFRFTTDGEDNG
jgi:hypothetical protein